MLPDGRRVRRELWLTLAVILFVLAFTLIGWGIGGLIVLLLLALALQGGPEAPR